MKHAQTAAKQSFVLQQKNAYFIAANGYTGFRSRYDSVFSSHAYTHVYIITGGPGTGKSHMMKRIACTAEEKGAVVQYIYCSSDPDSLDGIILTNGDRRIAMLDGTAPHTRSADFPGAIDEVTNLGEFWNSSVLMQKREEIIELCRQKSAGYEMAYRYLALAGAIDHLHTALLASCIDHEKMQKAVQRMLGTFKKARTPEEKIEYRNACSMKGKISFSPMPENAELICIDDYLGSGRFFLNALRDALREAGQYSYTLIPSCYTDDRTEEIYLPQNNTLILCSEEGSPRTVHMRRFLRQAQTVRLRPRLRRLLSLHEDMTDAAVSALREAGVYHFALEKIYGAAMDFEAANCYIDHLAERIGKQLFLY